MNKIIIISILFGSAMLLLGTSCDDYLEEDPIGTVTAESYLTTSAGFEFMVKAAYEPIRYVTRNKDPFYLGTDMYTQPGGGLDTKYESNPDEYSKQYLRGFNEYYKTACDANNGPLNSLFIDSYTLIQRCNSVIAYADNADITSATKAQRVGEMKFLRAFAYYLLVENFSGVPLLTEMVTSPHLSIEITPEEKIYDFLINDLEECYQGVAPKSQQNEWGRVTRGAIKMLLSKLYLTRAYKSYAKSDDAKRAYDLAVDIINTEGYRLIDFDDIFKEGNEINDEIIFSVQYSDNLQLNWGGNTDYSTFQPFIYALPGMGAKDQYLERYTGNYAPTRAAYLLFDRSWDKRFDITFQREYFANENKPAEAGAFGAIVKGQKMIECVFPGEPYVTQEEKDKLNYFVVNVDEYYDQPLVGGIKDDNGDYRVNGYAVDATGARSKARYYVYPGIRKFRDSKALYSDGGESGTRDHFEFRLGEVYLLAAEASLKAGTGEGARYLQTLRNRAAYNGNAPALDLTIDNILDERARELMGEERRFIDLRRTGKIRERVITKKMNERAARASELFGDMAFRDELTTRPLPFGWSQYIKDGFEQNPGYDF